MGHDYKNVFEKTEREAPLSRAEDFSCSGIVLVLYGDKIVLRCLLAVGWLVGWLGLKLFSFVGWSDSQPGVKEVRQTKRQPSTQAARQPAGQAPVSQPA